MIKLPATNSPFYNNGSIVQVWKHLQTSIYSELASLVNYKNGEIKLSIKKTLSMFPKNYIISQELQKSLEILKRLNIINIKVLLSIQYAEYHNHMFISAYLIFDSDESEMMFKLALG